MVRKWKSMGNIPERQLSRLSTYVAARMGLHFPEERWQNLEQAINLAAGELDCDDGESCIEWLLSSSPTSHQIEILASHLTVGETYFFRDKGLFKALEQPILSELIRHRRSNGKFLRIWSAGCSSGEEPYSIAILLSQMIPDIEDWNISILATDFNARSLQKAVRGVYGPWSFRDVKPEIKKEFFKQTGDGRFELISRVRKMVDFCSLNLVEDSYPSLVNKTNAFDIILCRNVLMYFVGESAQKVVKNLHRSLLEGGLLIVSPIESSVRLFSQFSTVSVRGRIFFKKQGAVGAGDFPARLFETPKPALEPAPNPDPAAAPVFKSVIELLPPRQEEHGGSAMFEVSNTDDPNPKELYEQASALYLAGSYPEAIEKVEKLLLQSSSDAAGWALLTRIYANCGKLDKALECSAKAVSSDKLNAGYHYLMATIFQELDRTEDAAVSLRRALYIDSKFIPAHVALGNICRKSGDHKNAARHFENALFLLNSEPADQVLAESEGINAQRLTEILRLMQQSEIEE